MAPVTFGGGRPELRTVAETVHQVLTLERSAGLLPEHSELRVFAINDEHLIVAVGGLDTEFLLADTSALADGPIPAHHYHLRALRLWRAVEDIVRTQVPRTSHGHPWFDALVWMQPEPAWGTVAKHPEGVIVVEGGEIR